MTPIQKTFDAARDREEPVAVRGLHTVAMVAAVLDVPVAAVRHWVRGGLLVASRRSGRIDWFDYGELVAGRGLARLLRAGFGLREIDARLATLVPGGTAAEALRQEGRIVIDGRRLHLVRGDDLLGPGGQRQFAFCTNGLGGPRADASEPLVAPTPLESAGQTPPLRDAPPTAEELLALAAELEAGGDVEAAAEALRALLQAGGPSAQVSFMLGELLYRSGDLGAARERFYVAIELDTEHLEARTSLGCVLAELGDTELAEAALEGVLRQQPDYADAHWHLAGVLDEMGREEDATRHLRAFVSLAPESPWVRAAHDRLADRR